MPLNNVYIRFYIDICTYLILMKLEWLRTDTKTSLENKHYNIQENPYTTERCLEAFKRYFHDM